MATPSDGIEPLFNCHWDRDQPCAVGRGSCAFAGYPAWLAPYWCARVSEDERATRRAVFYAPPRPSIEELLGDA